MKKIILCAEGTWGGPAEVNPSNILKITRALSKRTSEGIPQIVYYHPGLGSGNWLNQLRGGIEGQGIDKMILDFYRFLVFNYEPDDSLYLFGFSRGAFALRSLAGFLHHYGLLDSQDEYLTQTLYELHKKMLPVTGRFFIKDSKHLSLDAKERLRNPAIAFMGLLDTVSSLRFSFNRNKERKSARFRYHYESFAENTDKIYQALAIDERRSAFNPVLIRVDKAWQTQHLEQCWFAGCHSDMGGGNRVDTLGNIPLNWLIDRSIEHGVAYHEEKVIMYKEAVKGPIHCKNNGLWRYLDYEETRNPSADAKMCQSLHASVIKRAKEMEDYYHVDAAFLQLPINGKKNGGTL